MNRDHRTQDDLLTGALAGLVLLGAAIVARDATAADTLTTGTSETCAAAQCPAQRDSKTASGRGTAIATTSTGAEALARGYAIADGHLNAAAKLKTLTCPNGCSPFGLPHISYQDFPGTCFSIRFDNLPSPPRRGDQVDSNGDGIGDLWASYCGWMPNRSIHDRCDRVATAAAKPWGAICFANTIATAVQLCADTVCMCAMAETSGVGDLICAEAVAAEAADAEAERAEP